MAEFKFSCPQCGQNIACDDLWRGQQLQCPGCQATLTVPAVPSAIGQVGVAPPAASAPRISIARHQPAEAAAPPPQSTPAPRPAPQRRGAPAKAAKKDGLARYASIAVIVIAAGVGCYYGFGLFQKMQKKFNEKQAAEAKKSDGGEMGHIANLYSVLDATDPSRHEVLSAGQGGIAQRARNAANAASRASAGENAGDAKDDPALLATPSWTLELNQAQVPGSRANGTISGTAFVPDTIRVDRAGTAEVLTLREGTGTYGDREILIYLHLKPGETVAGHNWSVTKDVKSAEVSQSTEDLESWSRHGAATEVIHDRVCIEAGNGRGGERRNTGEDFPRPARCGTQRSRRAILAPIVPHSPDRDLSPGAASCPGGRRIEDRRLRIATRSSRRSKSRRNGRRTNLPGANPSSILHSQSTSAHPLLLPRPVTPLHLFSHKHLTRYKTRYKPGTEPLQIARSLDRGDRDRPGRRVVRLAQRT